MAPAQRVLLGVTGSIAAYKAAEIVRLLVKSQVRVDVVMTRNAAEFITPLTLQTLSGSPVWTETFRLSLECEVGHIALVDASDLVLVAPATANIIAKAAAGIADDLLSTALCVAADKRVLFAPAMNVRMYENPVTQENIRKLKGLGYGFIEPEPGALACGHEGVGRLAEPAGIVEEVLFYLARKDLSGQKVLVTAGPTQEDFDPVRFLSNPSSGKMGFALARAAAQRGASVTLVSGPTHCANPRHVRCIRVRTAREMHAAVLREFADTTTVIMAAAVSDYRPAERAAGKIKKKGGPPSLVLEETPDILLDLGRQKGGRLLVGFAAETESLVENAREKMEKKSLDLIAVNDVSRQDIGFGADLNQVKLIGRDGRIEELPKMGKEEVAHRILDQILLLRRESGEDGAGTETPKKGAPISGKKPRNRRKGNSPARG